MHGGLGILTIAWDAFDFLRKKWRTRYEAEFDLLDQTRTAGSPFQSAYSIKIERLQDISISEIKTGNWIITYFLYWIQFTQLILGTM